MATIKDAIDIYQLSDATLKDYINELQDEVDRRKKAHRTELINEFKQALRNLQEAKIPVFVDSFCIECESTVSCSVDTDNVYFDDWR